MKTSQVAKTSPVLVNNGSSSTGMFKPQSETSSLKTISSSTSSILSIEEAKLSVKAPPFILNAGEYIEIKINGENSEALKLVLEFLYTDRIMSLEGRGNANLSMLSEVFFN
jgi:hypothetical protein